MTVSPDAVTSLARHTAVYGVGDLLGRAVSLLLVPLYARLLTAADNGVLALAYAFIAFTAVIYSLGLNPALIRYLSGEADEGLRRARFSSAFWTLLGVASLFSAAMWAGADVLSRRILGSEEHSEIFKLLAAIVWLDSLAEPLFTLCRARQRSATYAAIKFVQYSFQMTLTIYLIAGLGMGVRAVFWSNLASSSLAFVALCPLGISHLRLSYAHHRVRELLAFGIPFVPSALATLVINLSDRFLVKYFLGLEMVGVYGIVYRLGLPMLLVVRAFRAAWAPALLSLPDAEEGRKLSARITTYFCLGGMLLFLGVSAYARELIHLISGRNAGIYLEGQAVVPIVTLGFVFYGIYVILTGAVFVESRTRMLPIIVGAGAATNVVLNVLLIPRIGLVGAAWGTLAANVTMAVALHLGTRRFYRVAYERERLLKICAVGLVLYLVISAFVQESTATGIVARGLLLLSYPFILWGWSFFEPHEWERLRSVLGMRVKREPAHGPEP